MIPNQLSEDLNNQDVNYLPHHAVIRKNRENHETPYNLWWVSKVAWTAAFPQWGTVKNHDDDFVDDGRKWDTVHYACGAGKFRRRGVVDDAKQSRIMPSCNPQACAGINPCPLHSFIRVNQGIPSFFSSKGCWLKIRLMNFFYFEEWQQL